MKTEELLERLEAPVPNESWRFEAASQGRKAALVLARRVAPWPCPILITGPPGVGKDLLAEDIHRQSTRAAGPFVVLSCAALPSAPFDGEVFGYPRAAIEDCSQGRPGLIELAHGGTLFVDELGEMPADAQAKLLMWLQRGTSLPVGPAGERRADVRVIAATTRDPGVELGKSFRRDLFYQLSAVTIAIPELAPEDASLISRSLVREAAEEYGLSIPPATLDDLAQICSAQRWPGGAREMKSMIERSLLLGDGRFEERLASEEAGAEPASAVRAPHLRGLERISDLLFIGMLRDAGSVRALSQQLDCTSQTVYNRLRRIGVRPRDIAREGGLEQLLASLRDEVREWMPWVGAILHGRGRVRGPQHPAP